jgi:hypothetical protein
MRPRVWQVGFPHSPALVQISLSSFKLSFVKWLWLLLCFTERDSSNRWTCAVLPSNVFILLKYMFSAFYVFWGYFIFLILVLHNVISCCNHKGILYWNWIPVPMLLMFVTVSQLPFNHRHWDCTVAVFHRSLLITGDRNLDVLSLTGRNRMYIV